MSSRAAGSLAGGTLRVKLPKLLQPHDVEAWILDAAAKAPTGLSLDLSDFENAVLYAEARLLAFLEIFRRRSFKILTRVPWRLSDDIGELPRHSDAFTRHLAGFVIGQLADRIEDESGRDQSRAIRLQQSTLLARRAGLLVSSSSVIAPLLLGYGRPAPHEVVLETDLAQFESHLRLLIRNELSVSAFSIRDFGHIATLAFEVLQNTRDHASKDIKGDAIDGVRYLALRRFDIDALESSLPEGHHDPLRAYLSALFEQRTGDESTTPFLLELTISDCGDGIAARMAKRLSVYQEPIETERALVLDALKLHGSSKEGQAGVGAGVGLFKVMRTVHDLGAFLTIRSGRVSIYKHYLGSEVPWPSTDAQDFSEVALPVVRGTAVTVLIPCFASGQTSLL